MSWKNWPSWVKGGVIGGALFLVWYFLIIKLLPNITLFAIFTPFTSILATFLLFLVYGGGKELGVTNTLPYFSLLYLSIFLDFALWFAIGALIGRKIGKLKSKSKKK